MARRHSPFGIASFVLSLFVLVALVAAVVLAAALAAKSPAAATTVGLSICALMGLNLLGACLGVVGLLQKDRSPTFSVLGAALNALTLLGICLLMFFGVVAK